MSTRSKSAAAGHGQPSTSSVADPLDIDDAELEKQEIYLCDLEDDAEDDISNPLDGPDVTDVEFVPVDDFFAEKFHCNRCDVEFVSVAAHIREHHSNQRVVIDDEVLPPVESKTVPFVGPARRRRFPFPCSLCGYMFTSNDDRDVHMQVQHDHILVRPQKTREQLAAEHNAKNRKRYALAMEKAVQMGDRRVKSKNVARADQPPRKYVPQPSAADLEASTCTVCNTKFSNLKSLKLHMRMHLPVKVITYEDALESDRDKVAAVVADDPGDSTAAPASPTELSAVAAAADANSEAKTFFCEQCDKSYATEFQTIHEQSHAVPAGERHRCTTCNITFESTVLLAMHTAAHQQRKYKVHDRGDTPLPYVCTFCGKAFARPHEKVKHERIHTGEKPHGCEICGKTFRVAFCLTLHMRSHSTARPYVCPHCNKRYKTSSVYNHHLMTHSDARPYPCTFCPKAFKTAVQLAGHKNSHTKPFPCSECNRPFSTLYAVRLHMQVHQRTTNKMTHVCKICGASYTRPFALNNHMKEQHPDEPFDALLSASATATSSGSSAAGKRRAAVAKRTVDAVKVKQEQAGDDADGDDIGATNGNGDDDDDDVSMVLVETKEEEEHNIVDDDELLAEDIIVEMNDAGVELGEMGEQFVGEEIVVDWMK